ncbi:translation initiation factor IF-2 [Odoribacter sp. Z80]|uniref:translation initiation factor IF-2 n=1 Tax=Odoribacter sp. Z80 TaxID=2304575 RepID=UPI001379B1C1|nr:translation initiation factor IF-2 [Odoribacter sp. Z80]NCE71684.1 translation initiation factor IF-2 [Odoribacter sp. Z80]
MAVRLSKIAREFNVGLSTIVEFLHSKGIKISSDPNAKLTDEDYALVAKEFSSDSLVKKESSLVDLKNSRKKKETVTLDEAGNVSTETETQKSEDDFISIKDEVKLESKLKIVDHIDLDHKTSVTETPEITENTEQASEPEEMPEVQTPASETKEEIPEVKEEPQEPGTPFKLAQPALKDVKVVGTIDLDAINQRTRPPKKSKQEKERDRKELRKSNKPIATSENTISQDMSEIAGEEDSDIRKKRKRIHRQDEKVQLEPLPSPNKNAKIEENKRKLKKLKKKKNEKTEISEEDIDKQIKDTFARLGSKGKSQTAKHRRDKRDAAQQKLQAEIEQEEKEKSILKLTEFVTVAELATMMNISVTEVISACMSLGLFVSINQRLDAETINIVADEFGYSVEFVSVEIQEAIEEEEDDSEENMLPRPPIVTVMGHVDHGKTSLLDSIRKTNVIAGEAGGITQHIGAYNVKLADGRAITFLDTPGHEAFTAMRARGAQVTDIAIIIVAADDSVMPQTIEAINHASAAGVPIVFAINKIDKPGANPDKIREELANMNYLVEEWGGKYQCQEIAAKKGLHIEELLEKVLLEAELLDLKANPHKKATGSIIESSLDKGRGYVATILVQSGTLKTGDIVLAGQYFGHIKAMFNERGEKIEKAGPSEPTLILGLNGAPQAGDKFNVMADDKEARQLANKREQLQREQGLRTQKHITLDEIGRRIAIGNFQELNIIVKGDVDGSIEALSDSLIKMSTDEIQVNIIHKAVGQITEGDVLLAAASNAIIVGFQVRPSMSARKLAEKEQIDIRLYSVIYQAIEELKSAMEGMLSPEIKEEIIGTVEVLETFRISKVGTIAGCIVRDGKINRTAKVRVIRDGIVIYTGALGSLKRFKDDVKEVAKGFECGLNIENYNDIAVGDIVEGYQEVEVKKTL